ncbi:MAG TPA: hypothetical protein VEH10_03080 [Thermoplasmata archaeon]|nr:hypothetical protein [Thermoplasmata archaeon]
MGSRRRASTTGSWTIEGLAADGPCPEYADKLALFGQFVGDWDIVEWRNLAPDGTWTTGRGELHWRWILEGRAVQDVWATMDKVSGRCVPLGTTLRFYDPKIDAWHSVWISPVNHVARQFVARQVGSEIVLEGKNAQGVPVRWIFSDIRRDAFRWREETQGSSPSSWLMDEEMRIERRRST